MYQGGPHRGYPNDRRGTPLSSHELKALVEKRRGLDLFLNFVAPGPDGYVAGRTNADGTYDDVSVTPASAALIAELVQERRPLRAMGMKCVRHGGIGHAVRAMQRARKSVDLQLGRTTWRSIRTISPVGGDDTTMEFFFDPPAELKFAVVVKG